jgi:signal transduction histidine kinase
VSDEPTHILLVEDEVAHAELVQRAFEERGSPVQLQVATTLSQARARLAAMPTPPDLIIADWRLPDGEGMELLMPEREGGVPVIIMTSHGNERVAVEALKAGALDYVVKSDVTLVDMPHIAERAYQQWRLLIERQRTGEEIKRLNLDLQRRARELGALNQAGQWMAATLDLDTLLERLLEQVRSLLDVDGTSVLLCAPDSDKSQPELVFVAVTGPGADKLLGQRLPFTAGITGWVAREKRPALVADAQNDPRFDPHSDADTGVCTRTLLAVPLTYKGQVLGVVVAVNKSDGAFDLHDQAVLEALCSSAAIAIENAQLYSNEQQRAAELARALDQQRELDRLQREFIQNVSHELRTPLALIRGHAEALEIGWLGELRPEQQKSVAIISRRSQMLSKLVDDIVGILTLEKRGARKEPVDMAQIVQASILDFQSAASQAGLTLAAEVAPNLPPLLGDSIALRRALDNLISNAVKFTPAGGQVTVRLSRYGDTVTLQVADTGIGIPGDQLSRIFERFYQVDGSATRQYGGVGLGLTLVKEIVEAHGGQIKVDSQVGAGTTFTIIQPIL